MGVLIVIGAPALLAGAAVHVAQLASIFHAVPWVGPLFAADAVVSTAVAVVLLVTRRRLAAAAGALVSAGALAGLALSSTAGLFGWHEATLRPAVVIAIAAEVIAVGALTPLTLPAPPRTARAWRGAAGAGLVAVAVLHVAAAGAEWDETRGVFWLFIALAAACMVVAGRLALGLDRWAWAAVLGLALLPIAGYVLSRTTGLPGATDDVGDWANPVGVASLALEAALVLVAVRRPSWTTDALAAARPVAAARDGDVAAGAAIEPVAARASDQHVAAGAAEKQVGPRPAGDPVAAPAG